ncbi:uncharacterized protein LOC110983498, partial [Acanthaster planci]|uniref:Uncharacterized protein LOC110983498 n=1 Tax=Acanthaster planci TaxID=133434 RepID=A0A8B7YYS6_ACAPL
TGTEACVKVCAIIEKTSLVKDIRKMSCSQQTSSLESFHSLINQFAPKMKAFSHAGIVSRLHLAALHYNENSDRQQATTQEGVKRYRLSKPKYKKGEATVKPIKEPVKRTYVADLMGEVAKLANKSSKKKQRKRKKVPPSLASGFTYPTKTQLIEQHCSRFSDK